MSNEPETIPELRIWTEGKFESLSATNNGRFDTLENLIKGTRKVTFWVGGLTGGVFGAIVALILKAVL